MVSFRLQIYPFASQFAKKIIYSCEILLKAPAAVQNITSIDYQGTRDALFVQDRREKSTDSFVVDNIIPPAKDTAR